jgi:hypothetical protein
VTHASNGILLVLGKKEILLHATTSKNLEYIMLNEINLSQRKTLYDSTCMKFKAVIRTESRIVVARFRRVTVQWSLIFTK